MRRLSVLCAVATLLPGAGSLDAQVRAPQAAVLVGMTRDSAGVPVSNVEVWIRGTDLYTHTNEIGGFRIAGAPAGSVKVSMRRVGFEQANVDLELRAGRIDSLVVQLTSLTPMLDPMKAEADALARSKELLAGFWDRRKRGNGHFMTRDEIIQKNAQDFSDIVRSLPGVTITSINGRRQVRFSRAPTLRGDCPPLYFVDNIRLENASGEEFPPGDIEALEVYNGSANIPPQFQPRAVAREKTCGVIVVWTRLPGT